MCYNNYVINNEESELKMQDLRTKNDYIAALLERANGDDVFANLEMLSLQELKNLWDNAIGEENA